jgi:hypothetical protein
MALPRPCIVRMRERIAEDHADRPRQQAIALYRFDRNYLSKEISLDTLGVR